MQRWMQAKEQLARKHGRTISGAGRAMGSVLDDRELRDSIDRTPKPRKPKVARVPCMKADKPPVWGAKRRERAKGFNGTFAASSRMPTKTKA